MFDSSSKTAGLFDVFGVVFMLGLFLLIAYFVHPRDAKRYEGWFMAPFVRIWHGVLWWMNVLFGHANKAVNASTAYGFWWWIGAEVGTLQFASGTVKALIGVRITLYSLEEVLTGRNCWNRPTQPRRRRMA
jgi:hypothetical protein